MMFKQVLFDDFDSMLLQKLNHFPYFIAFNNLANKITLNPKNFHFKPGQAGAQNLNVTRIPWLLYRVCLDTRNGLQKNKEKVTQ